MTTRNLYFFLPALKLAYRTHLNGGNLPLLCNY